MAMPLSSGKVSSTPPMRLSRAPNHPISRKATPASASLLTKTGLSAIKVQTSFCHRSDQRNHLQRADGGRRPRRAEGGDDRLGILVDRIAEPVAAERRLGQRLWRGEQHDLAVARQIRDVEEDRPWR